MICLAIMIANIIINKDNCYRRGLITGEYGLEQTILFLIISFSFLHLVRII